MAHPQVVSQNEGEDAGEGQTPKKSLQDLMTMRRLYKCFPTPKRLKDKVVNRIDKVHMNDVVVSKCILDIIIFFHMYQKVEKKQKVLRKAIKVALQLHKKMTRDMTQ